MEINFHYFVTYTAAVSAGFTTNSALLIARAAQYVDERGGVTVQGTCRMIWDNLLDTVNWTNSERIASARIWPIFHFLPGDYNNIRGDVKSGFATSGNPMLRLAPHLICSPESSLTACIVDGARATYRSQVSDEEKLLRIGITMHVLADTFAHQGFAGIPLPEVNEVCQVMHFQADEGMTVRDFLRLKQFGRFERSPAPSCKSFGYLGHGRIGHLPDQPGETFHYISAWHNPVRDAWITRYNPLEYYCAYLQMVEAMEYISGTREIFTNYVDRGVAVDQRGPAWAQTEPFLRAFTEAYEDANLLTPWFALFPAIHQPPPYQAFQSRSEAALIQVFDAMAEEHRILVLANCASLRDYLKELGD